MYLRGECNLKRFTKKNVGVLGKTLPGKMDNPRIPVRRPAVISHCKVAIVIDNTFIL